MEGLRLKPRQPVEEQIESWDDGDLMIESDTFSMKSGSTTTRPPSRRRDSNSSHISRRSDLESWAEEEEQQVHIPGDDENSTMAAISAAQNAGIPLPKNVPSSALMGGTIKRLGGRKIRRIIQEDWENDLELPDASHGLKIKAKTQAEFPDSLRQVSGGSIQASPTKSFKSFPTSPAQSPANQGSPALSNVSVLSAAINLDKFKDNDDDEFFGDGCETIKVSKNIRQPKPVSLITPPTPSKHEKPKEVEEDFETDFELPTNGTLQLSTKRDIPKTPSIPSDDLDWGEGSLGTRWGGTRRDGRSNRSSSASALSPSVSSSITAESEDETFDGLVLPSGPVNFQEMLRKRKNSRSPQRTPEGPVSSPPRKISPKKPSPAEADKPDFLDGLDIGDGDVFNSGKLTLHKNIKLKETRPNSPARPKAAVSLTFTNKPSVSSRLPRLSHERSHSIPLEPVSESGGPIPQRARRPPSRFGHSSQSSMSSIPTPTTPSPNQRFHPSTPSRREIGTKTSTPSLRNEPTTTSAQLLKQKRSLPAIRALNPSSKQPIYRDRPSSRTDAHRPLSGGRPKTPNDQQRSPGIDSPASHARRAHQPFLPAGSSHSQHVTSKTARQFRRHDSDNSIDLRPNSRANSRAALRSPSPQHRFRVAADTWERLSRPKHKKHFGDGHELDGFDDLPTSKESETRFMKQPTSSGSKTSTRPRSSQNSIADRMSTPTPVASARTGLPHFARDTAASRIARETSLATRSAFNGPLAPIAAQRGTQVSRNHLNVHQATRRSKRSLTKPPQTKPHLISNLGGAKDPKTVNGMYYNADTFRWEGNENALNAFDVPVSTPSPASVSHPTTREKEQVATPRPALITNISATKGVQVVNGMVFDPQTMSWLKMGAQNTAKSESSDVLSNFNALDDEEDVFKDIPDLDDGAGDDEGGHGRVSDINDEWLVGEEFDVGPEFIRRQREEEERWRKKCSKWTGRGIRDRETWRWTIRELVSQFDDLAV